MKNGMTDPKAKIAVTLDQDVLARVRAAVADGRARSVSAYVEHALAGQLTAEAEFDAMLAEILAATGGPPTAKERREARRLLDGVVE